jgi:hypothetical protein
VRSCHKLLSPRAFLLLVAPLLVACVLGICLLPHSRYVQFAALHDSSVVKAGWIYERIHFDETPIDVMFVGTSHTVFGVNSAQVEQAYTAATGHSLHVVNFGLQHLGRDIDYLLAREAIESRQVKLMVIEAPDDEPRSLHPAFFELATLRELLDAPIVINTSYLPNLARLPLRQITLFARSIAPGWFGDRLNFDPARYRGSNWDDTYEERGSLDYPVLHPVPRLQTPTAVELEQERAHYERLVNDKLSLPGFLQPLEHRANLVYLQRTIDLARRHGVAIHFLYLPSYGAPSSPRFATFYAQWGPLWYPKTIYDDASNWSDVNHLNYRGASELSLWLGNSIAGLMANQTALIGARHQP